MFNSSFGKKKSNFGAEAKRKKEERRQKKQKENAAKIFQEKVKQQLELEKFRKNLETGFPKQIRQINDNVKDNSLEWQQILRLVESFNYLFTLDRAADAIVLNYTVVICKFIVGSFKENVDSSNIVEGKDGFRALGDMHFFRGAKNVRWRLQMIKLVQMLVHMLLETKMLKDPKKVKFAAFLIVFLTKILSRKTWVACETAKNEFESFTATLLEKGVSLTQIGRLIGILHKFGYKKQCTSLLATVTKMISWNDDGFLCDYIVHIFSVPLLFDIDEHQKLFLTSDGQPDNTLFRIIDLLGTKDFSQLRDVNESCILYGWVLGNAVFIKTFYHERDWTDTHRFWEVMGLLNSKTKRYLNDFENRECLKKKKVKRLSELIAPFSAWSSTSGQLMGLFPPEIQTDLRSYVYKANVLPSDRVLSHIRSKAFCSKAYSMWEYFARLTENKDEESRNALLTLVLGTPLLLCLWESLQFEMGMRLDAKSQILPGSNRAMNDVLWEERLLKDPKLLHVMSLFLDSYNLVVTIFEEDELAGQVNPFNLQIMEKLIVTFRNLHVQRFIGNGWENMVLVSKSMKFLNRIYQRDVRRAFIKNRSIWLMERNTLDHWSKLMEQKDRGAMKLMWELPFTIPFETRVNVMRKQFDQERAYAKETQRPHYMQVRRETLVLDGLSQVNKLRQRFRGYVRVGFVDQFGVREEGQDMGGVFKEFLDVILREVFSDSWGLFKRTEGGLYYPNPDSDVLGEQMSHLMEFVGRMVGKAVYEGILVDVPLAQFFVSKLITPHVYLEDLFSMDPDRFKNLMYVKHCEAVEFLYLTFSITRHVLGEIHEIDLKPNGRNIDVTKDNRVEYVYAMVEYYTYRALSKQLQPFINGFYDIVDRKWLTIFNVNEFQKVLSGVDDDINVDDWEKHAAYDGGFSRSSKQVKWFWKTVRKMSPEEKKQLMRFTTSASRPPIMGFKHLEPPFTIRPIDAGNQGIASRFFFKNRAAKGNLPMAATCFNTLKLPVYNSKGLLEQKLKQAIVEAKGFQMA